MLFFFWKWGYCIVLWKIEKMCVMGVGVMVECEGSLGDVDLNCDLGGVSVCVCTLYVCVFVFVTVLGVCVYRYGRFLCSRFVCLCVG